VCACDNHERTCCTCVALILSSAVPGDRPIVTITLNPRAWADIGITPFPTFALPGQGDSTCARPIVRQWEHAGAGSGGAQSASGSNARVEWLTFLRAAAVAVAVSLPVVSVSLTEHSYRTLLLALGAIESPPSASKASPRASTVHPLSAVEQLLVAISVKEGTVNFVRESLSRSLCLLANSLTTLVSMPMSNNGLMDVLVTVHSLAGVTGVMQPPPSNSSRNNSSSSINESYSSASSRNMQASDAPTSLRLSSGTVVLHRMSTTPIEFAPEPMLSVRVKVTADPLYVKKTVVAMGECLCHDCLCLG
jgi:hypothetical protein